MHRHAYQGRKLQRAAGPRRALVRGLVTSLVLHEQVTTTEAKAKEMAPQFERLVTKAKKGDLHSRRQIRSILLTDKATEKLVSVIAPAFADRNGGYTRIVKLGSRQGDNAPMAAVLLTEKIAHVDDKPAKPAAAQTAPKTEAAATTTEKKAPAKKAPATKKPAARKPAAKKTETAS